MVESSRNKYFFLSLPCPFSLSLCSFSACFPLPPFVPTNQSTFLPTRARDKHKQHTADVQRTRQRRNQHQQASERVRRPSGNRTPARERAAPDTAGEHGAAPASGRLVAWEERQARQRRRRAAWAAAAATCSERDLRGPAAAWASDLR
jgi:hypothetical protein